MAAARSAAASRTHAVAAPRPALLVLPEPPAPLLEEGESPELWNQFRGALLADLAPHGAVEQMLADQIIECSWRLRRVQRHETDTLNQSRAMAVEDIACYLADTAKPEARCDALAAARVRRQTAAIDRLDAEIARLKARENQWNSWTSWAERLFELPDDQVLPGPFAVSLFNLASGFVKDRTGAAPESHFGEGFLAALGAPGATWQEAYTGPFAKPWTAARVRAGLERLFGGPVSDWPAVVEVVASAYDGEWESLQPELKRLRKKKDQARKAMGEHAARLGRQRTIPEPQVLKSICQLEGHLDRALHRAMAELRRWQALRGKRPAKPDLVEEVPAVAEVSVPLLAVLPGDEPRVADEPRREPETSPEAVALAVEPAAVSAPMEPALLPEVPVAEPTPASPTPEAPLGGSCSVERGAWSEPRVVGLPAPSVTPVAGFPPPGPDWLSPYYSAPLTPKNRRRRARERVLAASRR